MTKLKAFIIKSNKGYVKFSTRLGDYNENSYFVGFSEQPETFFSSEYTANVNAKLCGLDEYEVKECL